MTLREWILANTEHPVSFGTVIDRAGQNGFYHEAVRAELALLVDTQVLRLRDDWKVERVA
jgi:hypothetical protein